MTFITPMRHRRETGKDPPMAGEIPDDIRDLIDQAGIDPVERSSWIKAMESHIFRLKSQGRQEDCDDYLRREKLQLTARAIEIANEKSRSRFKVVSTFAAPALITIVAKVISDHMPFG